MTIRLASTTKYGVDGNERNSFSLIDPKNGDEPINRKVSLDMSEMITEITTAGMAIKKNCNTANYSASLQSLTFYRDACDV